MSEVRAKVSNIVANAWNLYVVVEEYDGVSEMYFIIMF